VRVPALERTTCRQHGGDLPAAGWVGSSAITPEQHGLERRGINAPRLGERRRKRPAPVGMPDEMASLAAQAKTGVSSAASSARVSGR